MKRYQSCIIIAVLMLLTACGHIDVNRMSGDSDNQVQEVKLPDSTIEIDNTSDSVHHASISKFLIDLNQYFYEEDLEGFRSHIDEYGIYSITYFGDGRDPNRAILVFKEDVREDLVLVSSQSGKVGITLRGAFTTEISEVHFNDFVVENNALQKVDWQVKEERVIQNQLLEIIEGCQELILKNNKYIPQVFSLSNHLYAFSFSDTSEDDLAKFYGYWIIFEQIDESYVIRAIIELQ